MSEFKFACPVCGQHITADSSNSGTQIDCPTCFQKIVVPQAPASGNSNLILSAATANRPRPAASGSDAALSPLRPRGARGSLVPTVLVVLVLCGGAAAVYSLRSTLQGWIHPHKQTGTESTTNEVTSAPVSRYPVPTNSAWTMELPKAVIPNTPPAGRLHGNGFFTERALLTGGTLSLRQGEDWPPELGISVLLPAERGEFLSGKSIILGRASNLKAPRLILRWRDEHNEPQKQDFTSGYAMKLVFGHAAGGKMPGMIYVALPDEAQSFVAGEFEAEIKLPQEKTH